MRKKIAKLYLEECGLTIAAKIKETLEDSGLDISEDWGYSSGEVTLFSEAPDVKSESEQYTE